jgi:hypothetical protein
MTPLVKLNLRTQGWLSSSPLGGEPNCPTTSYRQIDDKTWWGNLVGGISRQIRKLAFAETYPPPNHAIRIAYNNQHRDRRDLAPPQGGSYRARLAFADYL